MPVLILYEQWILDKIASGWLNRAYFEPHSYVNTAAWMKLMQGLYARSKSVDAMRVFINIANNEIGYLERMRQGVLPAFEQQMKGWDIAFDKVKDEFAAYLPWLEKDPTPVATAATSAAVVLGFDGKPPIMRTLVELYNQLTPVVELGDEYTGAGAFVLNAYRAVDTQISKSAPGEEKTMRDYFDSSLGSFKTFFTNLPKAASNLAVIAALGFGAIAAIYLLKK